MDVSSFSNDEVIALLNAYFVPVRVEDAQRPDVNLRYNQNGWPTIAFMTPQGDHLVSVNYLPPEQFGDALVQVHRVYHEQRAQILEATAQARGEPSQGGGDGGPQGRVDASVVSELSGILLGMADNVYGGYGPDHKFPHVEANEFLLHRYQTTGDPFYLSHILLTLDNMKDSKTYDEKDGGFFRYSSKPDWSEPHREKLLIDHAGLLSNYLHAFLITERTDYKEMAEKLIHYLNATLSDPSGVAFYGCQDYVRIDENTPREGRDDHENLMSIIDDWVYTDANARTVSAYLDAWWILGRPDCRERALKTLEFLWERCRAPGGGVYHYYDGEPHVPGLLIDDVCMGGALLDAYRLSGEAHYLERARELAEAISREYRNPQGGFYDVNGRENLGNLRLRLTVIAENGATAAFFLGLADLSGEERYRQEAHWALKAFAGDFRRYGVFAAGYGHALAKYLSAPLQVTLEGRQGDPKVRALARAAMTQLAHPNLILRLSDSGNRGDTSDRPALAYLEEGAHRIGPVTDARLMEAELLASLRRS